MGTGKFYNPVVELDNLLRYHEKRLHGLEIPRELKQQATNVQTDGADERQH